MLSLIVSTALSLAIIEILLSLDNALVNATLAEDLPERQRKRALRIGIVLGALFRVGALFCAAFIIHNIWIRCIGALYLMHLSASHLGKEIDAAGHIVKKHTSFKRVIVQIAFADLVFSLDNVISAVSFSNSLAVVIVGVLIGIGSMLILTPIVSTYIDRFPALGKSAYVIVGLIGLALLLETLTPIHIHEVIKFLSILAIVVMAISYEKNSKIRQLLTPVFRKTAYILGIPYDFLHASKKVFRTLLYKLKA